MLRISFACRPVCFLGLALAIGSVSAQHQDPPAAKMLNESYFEQRRRDADATPHPIRVEKSAFDIAYRNAGRPKFVFLVGEEFGNLVSQWSSHHRLSIENRATGAEHTDVPQSQSSKVAMEKRMQLMEGRSQLLDQHQWEAYDRAFQSTLVDYGVRVINRDLAIRLMDAQIRQQTQRNPQDDLPRLEMDMLRAHSEVLVEVMPFKQSMPEYQSVGYSVAMTSLKDAVVMAEDAVRIPIPETGWGAGDSGYKKMAKSQGREFEAGLSGYKREELEQSGHWEEHGRHAALATVKMLYDRITTASQP